MYERGETEVNVVCLFVLDLLLIMTECLNSSSTEHLVLFQSDWSAGVEALSITLSGCISLTFKGSISVKRTCFKGAFKVQF